jgi:predicted transcriptional regulator
VLKRVKQGRAHVYEPVVSRDEVSRSVLGDLKDVLFADQLPSLMLGMLQDGKFSKEDLQTLENALRKVKQRGSKS